MAGILFKTKKRLEEKVNSCVNCVRINIEELKGTMEDVKRLCNFCINMALLEYYIEKGQGFALKASNGKYLTTTLKNLYPNEASNFEASKEEVDESCHFFIEKIDTTDTIDTIALKTASQIYVSRYTYLITCDVYEIPCM